MMQWNELRREMSRRVPSYFPELKDARFELELIGNHQRRFSQALDLRLDSDGVERRLFVKIPTESGPQQNASDDRSATIVDRPRLIPVVPINEEVQSEYAALRRMKEHFNSNNEQRHGSPTALDLIHDRAIVVENVSDPTLSDRLAGRHQSAEQLLVVLRNVGSWLKTFHQMKADSQSTPRLLARDELSASMQRCVAYLSKHTTHSSHLQGLQEALDSALLRGLPPRLDAVCGHGDFGPHNLFVHNDGRVTGFDTLAKWRTSRFEDLAYFLLLLETKPPLFCSRSGSSSLRRDAFLRGYFGEEAIPTQTLAWFEALVTLDKWVSVTHSTRKATGIRRVVKRGRFAFQQHWLKKRIDRLMISLAQNDVSGVGK